MPANTKPVPWNDIKRRVEAGEPCNAIAKDLTARGMKISKQAILKRRDREGWKVSPSAEKVGRLATAWQRSELPETATGNQLATGPSRSATQIANWGRRTPENAAIILASIEEYGNAGLAAQAAGIAPNTLKRWRDDDPDFGEQIDAANAKFCAKHMTNVTKASDRGDWKAAEKLLKVNPLTKDEWSDGPGSGGRGLNINFTFNRGAVPDEAEIIDVEAEEIG